MRRGIDLSRIRSGPVSKILAGSVIGQGLLIALSPVLTRLYGSHDFGVLAVFTAMVAIAGNVVTLKWESAIVLPVADRDARAVAWLGLLTTLSMTGLMIAVITLGGEALVRLFGSPELEPFLWLLPLTLFFVGFQKIGSSWFVRLQAYGKLGRRNLLQGVGQVAAQILGALLGARPLGLLVGLLAGRILASGGFLGRDGVLRGGVPHLRLVGSMAAKYRRFPLISTWSSLINSVGLQAPILVLSASYGAVAIGALALTMRVLASPVGIISDAVAQFYEGSAARNLRVGEGDLQSVVRGIVVRLARVGIIPLVVIEVLGPWLFSIVFGSAWRDAGILARIIAPAYFAQYVVVPVSRTLILLQKQGIQLAWDIGRAVVTVGSVSVLALFSAPLWASVMAFAAAQSVAYAVLLATVWHLSKSVQPGSLHRASQALVEDRLEGDV